MDAYEIGLDLAAPQGVGAGLALMQENMAAVEAAVVASFAEVPGLIERLGRAGAGAVSPAAGMGRAIWPPVAAVAVLPDVVADVAVAGGTIAPGAAAAAPSSRSEVEVSVVRATAVAPVREADGAVSSDVGGPSLLVAGRVDDGLATGEVSGRETSGGRAVAPLLVTAQVAAAVEASETGDRAPGGYPTDAVPVERDGGRAVLRQGGDAVASPRQSVSRGDVLRADVLRAGVGRLDEADVDGGRSGASLIGLLQAEDGREAWDSASAPALAPRGGAGGAGPATRDRERRAGGDGSESGDGASGGLFGERAAAPQPQTQDGGDGGGGTVMLDGRLVGQWLSERMARDAGRPGAGTTSFDPRQAPAWTPSGAL